MPTLAPPAPRQTEERARAKLDPEFFVDLLADHDRQMRALALRILGDPSKVDDALQEAYLRAWRALPSFRGDASLGTWLHRIVHNVCMDEHRRTRRRAEDPYDERSVDGPTIDAADVSVERADLAVSLAGLPRGQRAAIVLVDGYGIGHATAARMLGVRVGTVSSRVFRARTSLRRALVDHPGRA